MPRLFQSPEIKKPSHLSGGEFKEKVQVAPGQLFQRITPELSGLFYQMALFLPNRPTQGSQFTSVAFLLHCLEERSIQISMDGKGRATDNVFNERFWRSVKHEEIYLNDYTTVSKYSKGSGLDL